MESRAIEKMENTKNYCQLMLNLQNAYNEVFAENTKFAGSDIQAKAFGSLLHDSLKGKYFYAFTLKNEGNSWASFICPCLPDGSIPNGDRERSSNKITILLHWGMNYSFLNDHSSWGHEKCSYRVNDVDYSIVRKFENETESNYFNLFDAAVRFKITGEWCIEED